MRPLLAYLVLLLSLVVTYGRTLDAPLIWDDRHLILDAPQIAQNEQFLQRFREPFWIDDGSGDARAYYRPLTVLSFALDHALHGENPAGYHLTNAVLHTLNALLLLALLRQRRTDVLVALLLSAAWALHPRLTEAAGWVSGRTDVLATTFCFLALLVHRSRSFKRSLASAGLLFLGLASKEVALAGVAALAVKELCWRAPGSREPGAWKRGLVFTLPLFGALLAYGGLRLSALAGTKPLHIPLSLGERLGAVVEALGRYAFDLAVPWLPRAQQGQLGQPD
jgi:protein O-mannosyl-transferase